MTTLPSSAERPHATIPALDGFRAAAIVIVMCSHIGLNHVVPGQFGVTMFFFLSGYLITTLLRREVTRTAQVDLPRFYLRRVVRILPPMYLTMAFFLAMSAIGLLRPLHIPGLVWDLAFLSNYHATSGMPIGLWSLAVEEHFYMVFPVLLLILSRRFSFAHSAGACVALCGFVLAVRLWQAGVGVDVAGIATRTHTRVDSILFGAILALWNNPVADQRNRLPTGAAGYLLAIALLLPTFAIRDEGFRQTYRYTLQGLGLLVLFNTAIRDEGPMARLFDNRATRLIARWSYTLYLVHGGFVLALTGSIDPEPSVFALVAILLSFAYAMLMWRWVEHPLAEWRQRRERRHRNAVQSIGTDQADPRPLSS